MGHERGNYTDGAKVRTDGCAYLGQGELMAKTMDKGSVDNDDKFSYAEDDKYQHRGTYRRKDGTVAFWDPNDERFHRVPIVI